MAKTEKPQQPKQFLTVPQLAAQWHTSTPDIYKKIKTGRLAATKDPDGHYQITADAVRAFEMTARVRRRTPLAPQTAADAPQAQPAPRAPHHNGGDGEATSIPPRRRSADVFPEFRISLGDPGTFLRRLDDLFAEERQTRLLLQLVLDKLNAA